MEDKRKYSGDGYEEENEGDARSYCLIPVVHVVVHVALGHVQLVQLVQTTFRRMKGIYMRAKLEWATIVYYLLISLNFNY